MKKSTMIKAIIYALLAAIFYAINIPFSKLLLNYIPSTLMASFLYFGAAIGILIIYLFNYKKESKEQRLNKKDIPYTILMIVLDIIAPILLMYGIKLGKASNASLLNNFEIVATSLIAYIFFKEKISKRIWIAILLISLSSIMLSFDINESLSFSFGSLLVILATICWGIENNCTRKISNKSPYQIVILKGFFTGLGSLIIALILNERISRFDYLIYTLILGFVAYGLSIFMYIKAQRYLGAAKTSSFYAVSPFIAALLAFLIVKEKLTYIYLIALIIMILGSIIIVIDTLKEEKSNKFHIITHTHDGSTHTHKIDDNKYKESEFITSEEHKKIHLEK